MTVAAPSIDQIFRAMPGDLDPFARNYNRTPFMLAHDLHQHPLFSLPRLVELAGTLARVPGRVAYNVGTQDVARGWDMSLEKPFSAQEVLDQLESANAWMILKNAQTDPDYGRLLDKIIRELHQLSHREWEKTTRTRNMSIIITSPGRITPYHMDADCNYLLQIRGEKLAYVFNGKDRNVVTSEELERFYMGNLNAATYRDSLQAQATTFAMKPGTGIHIPVTHPHWVTNGNNISISVSINFFFVDRTIPDIHRINHYLRKAGLKPKDPGLSRARDVTKGVAAAALRRLRRTQ